MADVLNYNSHNAADYGISTAASKAFTYVAVGAADNDKIATITYKNSAGTAIGVLTITYVGATNNIAAITRTS